MKYLNIPNSEIVIRYYEYMPIEEGAHRPTAIYLESPESEDMEDAEEMVHAVATVNLPHIPQYNELTKDPGFVAIKEYGENEGITEYLIKRGVLDTSRPTVTFETGYVTVEGWYLTEEARKELQNQREEQRKEEERDRRTNEIVDRWFGKED